ncbi:MAG: PocR ligand-binding domain-containing protein [Syntrophomonas sp.]
MSDENLTKEQILDELVKLRQKNSELEIALKEKERISQRPVLVPPGRWFTTGRANLFVCDKSEQQHNDRGMKYRYSDLVDIPILQQLLNAFYAATGLPYGLIEVDNSVLSGIGWQDICTKFHRVCPQTRCRCMQSDSYIMTHLHDGPYVGYKCLNGLFDYSVPIIVDGEHLATISIGQLLHQPPDEEYFRCQAREYGFDETSYMEALHRVPIIPEEGLGAIMEFYIQLGNFLSNLALVRKRQIEAADQILRSREELLSLVLETSNTGVWDWNIETGELYFSPRWVDMLEYSPNGIKPHYQTWEKLLHPDDVTAARKLIRKHLKGRTTKFEAEYRMLSKYGKWKWILSRGQVVDRDEEGKPLRMAGTSIDITDRKRAEADLLLSEEKFSKLYKHNPDLISISTINEGRFVEINDAFIETSGYKRDEVIGHTTQDLDIWVVPEERYLIIKQVKKHGSIRNIETRFRMKSGEIRIFDISVEIIEINSEEHLIVTTRDITERKLMEENLRLSEECLSKAFNASPLLMALTTLEEGRIIKANDAFCRIIGCSPEVAIGRTTLEFGFWMNPGDRQLVQQKLMANKPVWDMEMGFCTKTGEQRMGLCYAERLDIHGEACMLGVVTDITKLRNMELEMTRLDRLNLVGELAASIGHEIRNPMTTVRGYLQILRENDDYIQEMEYFDLMIEELDRANSIITDFLSLAKNKMVDMQPTNLNAVINKSLPLIQARAISKDHYINLELAEIPDLMLDYKEIRQLILNLVNNGLESMSPPGNITIRTFIKDDKVVLAVQDQGHGIDHELLDKLGTPFLTTKEQGTGLGLAVCYRITAQHNARIDVETSSNGTTFFVSFPTLDS